jgi:urea transport system permease protein
MTKLLRMAVFLVRLAAALAFPTAASGESEMATRAKLSQAILADGAEQRKLVGDLADSGSRLVHDVLSAWTRDSVFLYDTGSAKVPVLLEDQTDADGRARAIRIDDGKFLVDGKNKELRFGANDLNSADTDAALRAVIQQALDSIALADPDPDVRASAVLKLGNSQKLKYVPVLQARLAKETDSGVRRVIAEAIAMLQLGDPDANTQTSAAVALGTLKAIGSREVLNHFCESKSAAPDAVKAARHSISQIEEHISGVNFFGTIFRGLSLGSILLVVTLGLAITFGLMGIINMAHGEMIAVGAYTTYVIQNLFGTGFAFSVNLPFHFFGHPIGFGLSLPGMNATGWFYESYFLFALPLSFAMAALAGLVLERSVIRFLYRRPLESLLATWGVSLVMQQLFRMVFGANNVQVNSPRWLLGHFTVDDVLLGYNRVFVIIFAVLIVVGTWLLLSKTPLGLLIRAVMQNRDMAACMGVRTARVNMMTFAFGSGLAGLGGAFLSQIGNVGPSMGQSYIVDSFMTVVVGGVGSIVGTVYSALGIGTSDQILQQVTGSPVTGKIVVLIGIILFLQWKPGGLFAIRSRSLD